MPGGRWSRGRALAAYAGFGADSDPEVRRLRRVRYHEVDGLLVGRGRRMWWCGARGERVALPFHQVTRLTLG